MSNPRQKALELMEVALDDSATMEERRTFAMKAVKHIDKHELLSSPLEELIGSENKTIRATGKVISGIMDPDFVDGVKTLASSLTRRAAGEGPRRRRRRRR